MGESKFKNILICHELNELPAIAVDILRAHPEGRIFALYGEMGAGKTTLIKEICRQLGVKDTVNSPTFSLVNVYNGAAGEVFHFDVYRMKTIEELYDIGYEDYFYSGQYCFIEWPEKIEQLLPEESIAIGMQVNHEDGSRVIQF